MLTEVALQHRVIPGIAEFARGGLPSPAATDDGNEWVDGPCWLYCGQRWTRVLWIRPRQSRRGPGPDVRLRRLHRRAAGTGLAILLQRETPGWLHSAKRIRRGGAVDLR